MQDDRRRNPVHQSLVAPGHLPQPAVAHRTVRQHGGKPLVVEHHLLVGIGPPEPCHERLDVTEKSTMIGEKHNQYSFVVVPDAKKSEVKAAVELLFKVQVSSVQILNLKGKQKRFGRFMGKRNDVRKAYVSLAKDQEIKFEQEVM